MNSFISRFSRGFVPKTTATRAAIDNTAYQLPKLPEEKPGSSQTSYASAASNPFSSETFASLAAAAKRKAHGRVNAERLHTFNKDLAKDALKEKGYWDINKDVHPINRRSWLKWEKKVRKESMFVHKIDSMPIDQKYRLRKNLLSPSNVALIIPCGMALYVVVCYVRYQIWGVTPQEASMNTARLIQVLPRAPNAS